MPDDDNRPFDALTWRDVGDGFIWQFADASGEHVAEVSFQEEEGQRWSWYVAVPEDWHYGNSPNPAGLAKSRAAAQTICEAILRGTVLR